METGQTITVLLPLQPDSEVAEAGRCLEVFFEGWLKEIYPEKQFAQPRQEDSDSEEVSSESACSTPQGFPWPPYMQEGIQPKRRRRHMVKCGCQLAGGWETGQAGGTWAACTEQPGVKLLRWHERVVTMNSHSHPLRGRQGSGGRSTPVTLRFKIQGGGCPCPGSLRKLTVESG